MPWYRVEIPESESAIALMNAFEEAYIAELPPVSQQMSLFTTVKKAATSTIFRPEHQSSLLSCFENGMRLPVLRTRT